MTTFDYLSGSGGVLHRIVEEWAARQPDKPFCETEDGPFTYRELDAQANRIARALYRAGMRKADAVAVYMHNRPELPTAMFGIQRAGAVYVPCSTYYVADELRYQLRHVDARLIFADAQTLPTLNAVRGECPALETVVLWDEQPQAGTLSWSDFVRGESADPIEEQAVTADDLAMVMYTSGTTARPKGIMFSHGHLVATGARYRSFLDWKNEDRFLHFFPMFHTNGGVSSFVPAVLTGATLVLVPHFSVKRFSEDLVRYDITVCNVNGTHVKLILNTPESDSDHKHRVRRMYLGLAPEEPLIQEFERRFDTKLYTGYGLSELLASVGTSPLERRRPGSAGRPARGISVRITDEQGADVPVGAVGEIRLHGEQRHELTMGYYRDEQKTQEAYGDGWLHTGDLGRRDADGYVWYEGRLKDLIKRSGFSIAVAEVERVIGTVAGVEECAVVGTPDRMREEAIVAFVVPTHEGAVEPEAVFAACRADLAEYKVPQFVKVVPTLPRDFLGKLDRKALREVALGFRIDTTERTPLGGPAPR